MSKKLEEEIINLQHTLSEIMLIVSKLKSNHNQLHFACALDPYIENNCKCYENAIDEIFAICEKEADDNRSM